MSNPSDKELDHLSREAAGRFEPDESISSWEKMEQLLDKEDDDRRTPVVLFFNRRPIIYGLLLLSIGLLSYFLLTTPKGTIKTAQKGLNTPVETAKNNSAQPSAGDQSSGIKTKPGNNTGDKTIEATAIKSESLNAQPNSTVVTDHIIASDDTHNKTLQPLNSSVGSGNTLNQKTNQRKDGHLVSSSTGSSYIGEGNGSSNQQAKPTKGNRHTKVVNQSAVAGGSLYAAGSATKEQSLGLLTVGTGPLQNVSDKQSITVNDHELRHATTNHPINNSTAAKKDSRPLRLHNPLHLGVLIAPDYTTVKSASTSKLSSNIGLSIGYQLFNHWSVNTGLTYTIKNYTAMASDFHGNSMWGLSYVDGNCHMIEIPLTIRYDFTTHSKTNFFVNGGLSSYLMRKESYDYYYTGVTDPYKKSYTTNESYWLAEASFSFGVEHQINKNFSVQVEPFVRAPLSGVGYGNIYLSSYGVAFSLRYSPWFRSKAKTGH